MLVLPLTRSDNCVGKLYVLTVKTYSFMYLMSFLQ
jgi:hypothetical protein